MTDFPRDPERVLLSIRPEMKLYTARGVDRKEISWTVS